MSYAGIDYGLGQSNIDKATGIRFGVISQNSVNPDVFSDVEYDYGKPTCPQCGNATIEYVDAKHGDYPATHPSYRSSCADYACESCKVYLDSSEVLSDEPQGWNYNSDGYALQDCLDSDIFVLKSPYYTFAQFCSPCVPGACSLDSPMPDGAKCYCLGHDWFDAGRAPYPVYSVETETEILPD